MEPVQDKSIFDDFTIDEEAKSSFTEIARWININAITGFASLAISLITTISAFVKISRYGSFATAAGGMNMAIIVISVAISLLLNILLFQAAANIRKAVEANNQELFGTGVSKLATYFRIVGILIIIALALFVLVLLFAIVVSSFRGL